MCHDAREKGRHGRRQGGVEQEEALAGAHGGQHSRRKKKRKKKRRRSHDTGAGPRKVAGNQQAQRRARCTHPAVALGGEPGCADDGLNLNGAVDLSRSPRSSTAAEEEGEKKIPPVVSASRSHGSGELAGGSSGGCSADLWGAPGAKGFVGFGGRRGDKYTPGMAEPRSSRPNSGSVSGSPPGLAITYPFHVRLGSSDMMVKT